MGILRAIGRLLGRVGERFARRSKWLAKRLWVITVADLAILARRHWVRLEPDERDRFRQLAIKSKGRPSKNLSRRERSELDRMLEKMRHWDFASQAVRKSVPLGGGLLARIFPKNRETPELESPKARRRPMRRKATAAK